MTCRLVIEGLHAGDRDDFLRQARQQGVTPAAWFRLLVRHASTLELGLRRRAFIADWEAKHDPLIEPEEPMSEQERT